MVDQAALKRKHAAYAKRTGGGRHSYRRQIQQVNERKVSKSHFDLEGLGNLEAAPKPHTPFGGLLKGLANKGRAFMNKARASTAQFRETAAEKTRSFTSNARAPRATINIVLSGEALKMLSEMTPEQRQNVTKVLHDMQHQAHLEQQQAREQKAQEERAAREAEAATEKAQLEAAAKEAEEKAKQGDVDPAKAITLKGEHFDRRVADGDMAELSQEEMEEAGINNIAHGLLARDALTQGEAPAHGADSIYRDNKTGALYIGGRGENGDVSVRPITDLPSEEAIIDAGVAHDTVILNRIETLNAAAEQQKQQRDAMHSAVKKPRNAAVLQGYAQSFENNHPDMRERMWNFRGQVKNVHEQAANKELKHLGTFGADNLDPKTLGYEDMNALRRGLGLPEDATVQHVEVYAIKGGGVLMVDHKDPVDGIGRVHVREALPGEDSPEVRAALAPQEAELEGLKGRLLMHEADYAPQPETQDLGLQVEREAQEALATMER